MRAIGFLFNNEQAVEPLSSYVVTVDSIESLTNMDFFAPLPDEIENKIEATCKLFSLAELSSKTRFSEMNSFPCANGILVTNRLSLQ